MIQALLTRLRNASNNRRARHKARRIRLEHFGAIIQLHRPQALVFVDQTYAAKLGAQPKPADLLWQTGADGEIGNRPLSAPLEAHMQLTNACGAGCKGCYTAASPQGGKGEWGLEQWKRALDHLAAMGIFHVALGGGESARLPWLGDIARYARDLGIVPNLTTSGLEGLEQVVEIADLFGQINVSIDGLGETYAAVRGFDGFSQADHAVQLLRERVSTVGINVVVTRTNFDQIPRLFEYARKRRLNEVELLRFKPAGRGRKQFSQLTCLPEQHRSFLPTLLAACKRYRIRARVDCSYTPMLTYHKPVPISWRPWRSTAAPEETF